MEAKQEVNAKKETYGKDEAIRLIGSVNHLLVAKGKKIVEVNLRKDNLAEDEILKLILGPTGNLRAPTLKLGKKLIVGFNLDTYQEHIG